MSSTAKRMYDHTRYLAHRTACIEKTRAWEVANPDRAATIKAGAQRRYHATHPVERTELEAIRRARKLGAFTEDIDRLVVFERDEGMCGRCHEPVSPTNWHLDHIIPLVKGGSHSYGNVQVMHPLCNLRKGTSL